jgi:hypothetical protein
LINVLAVTNGLITTKTGMSYRILALDANSRHMSLPVLRKISEMVKAGAVVVGDKPIETPSMSDDQNEFKKLSDEVWALNSTGSGKVYAGQSISDVLKSLNIVPDFTYSKPQANTTLLYVHRKLKDVDFYWVNNRNPRVEEVEASFRVEGRAAELWHPETGKTEQASCTIENGVTKVPLHLESSDAVFVVFRNTTSEKSKVINPLKENQLAVVEGPWDISFLDKKGGQSQATFASLSAWNENSDPAVKYFSGTGTYSKTIDAKAEWLKEGTQLCLDLGDVKNLAEVVLNGKSLGIIWKTPFRINITGALKQGENKLDIKVTNLWVNRLIGDQQSGVTNKFTYTTMPFYRADSPLKPSGLMGPVRLISILEN